jgi:CRISPR-associated endonuclease Csn1
VQVRPGGLTKSYREAWKLNSILGDGETNSGGSALKPRHDHRHHAVDAAVIAVADQDMFTRLSNAAKYRQLGRRERFGDFNEPWPGFRSELSDEVLKQIVVSHRVSGKVSGGLHKDKNYSAKDPSNGFRRIRIPVAELSLKDLTHDAQLKQGDEPIIVDPGVRERVLAKWRERSQKIGSEEPEKVFSEGNLPLFEISKERHIEIRKVRIRFKLSTIAVGHGRGERHVKAESNHHIEVFRTTDKKGRVKWSAEVVDMLTAYRRKNGRLPIMNPKGRQDFLFSLSPGEVIECRKGEHVGKRLVVRGMRADDKRIFLVHINDARKKGEMQRSGDYLVEALSSLQDWDVRKIVVSPLGEVSEAHG